jgi:hypothetical protein
MKKFAIVAAALLAVMLISCESTDEEGSPDDIAVAHGVTAWNEQEPAAAEAYWADIKDSARNKKYQNYIVLYNAGVTALDSTDAMKATQESKLLAACNTALDKFLGLDSALKLPADVCEKGANLAAPRISKLLANDNPSAAKKLYNSAKKVYGENDALAAAGKEVNLVNSITTKKSDLSDEAAKARAIDTFDEKIAAYDQTLADYNSAESEINSAVNNSGLSKSAGVVVSLRGFKKDKQDFSVERESIIRERAYEYKDRIGAEFARTPDTDGKNGKMSLEDILAHYQSVKDNIEKIYSELLTFAKKYPDEIGQDILDDVNAQRKDLEAKIAQVNKEISTAKEIASRGKVVMPIMIGLFNPDPRSTAESKKSRPAKFSATKVKDSEYWWGMVSIPKGQMNDLVITLKDNRTVRVFNENTKSGKLIKKNNLKDLVNRSYKVGNSWPVLNAGSQLTTDKYFFEVQEGKTDSYEGEVVVYSSFVVRMR